eukprot:TRINITY_DN65638_c0_g1_i1.p1 TRINITY_DN65638_c0_g1~~TRINITY_DN65638_c0_g1_i1.p1  ORF type:complete len:634 (+),score=22.57 TRINITY_DN65638_c0_g1_i1:28-1929(+)
MDLFDCHFRCCTTDRHSSTRDEIVPARDADASKDRHEVFQSLDGVPNLIPNDIIVRLAGKCDANDQRIADTSAIVAAAAQVDPPRIGAIDSTGSLGPLNIGDQEQIKLTRSRSRLASWTGLSQNQRGIEMGEILDFYQEQALWIEQLRWRCGKCHQSCLCPSCSSGPSGHPHGARRCGTLPALQHGPCQEASCAASCGEFQMRNLHEVNGTMIKPVCEKEMVSYVELLRRWEAERLGVSALRGRPVDAFVSHWWGEEFPHLVDTLKRFADTRCATWFRLPCRRLRSPLSWCFWICAFANNQYAIENALGDGDVYDTAFFLALKSSAEVVAVLDSTGEIYKRIWCAFELFVAKVVLKDQDVEVVLANPHGVLTLGDASPADKQFLNELITSVDLAHAGASVEADKVMILRAVEAANYRLRDLNDVLINLTASCSCAIRAREAYFIFCVGLIPCLSGVMAYHLMRGVLTTRPYLFFESSHGRWPPLVICCIASLACGFCVWRWRTTMQRLLASEISQKVRSRVVRRCTRTCVLLSSLAMLAMLAWAPISVELLDKSLFNRIVLGNVIIFTSLLVLAGYPLMRRWLPVDLRRRLEDPLFAATRQKRLERLELMAAMSVVQRHNMALTRPSQGEDST